MYLCPCKGTNRASAISFLADAILARARKKWDKQVRLSRRAALIFSSTRPVLLSHVYYVFGKGVFLIFLECPGGPEMIVVDEFVHGVMHVSIIRALQIRGVLEFEGQRLGLRCIRAAHRRRVGRRRDNTW